MASAMVQVNVRVPPELHNEILKEKHTYGITVSEIINRALRAHYSMPAPRREKGAA